jgi:TatA/E family protein of Tat protein translocase
MFGSSIGAGEILLILAVVLLLFGAQRLPEIARSLGRALEEFRRSARDLTRNVLDDQAAAPPTASPADYPHAIPPPAPPPGHESEPNQPTHGTPGGQGEQAQP